jgi:biopolymer transport protein ExbD
MSDVAKPRDIETPKPRDERVGGKGMKHRRPGRSRREPHGVSFAVNIAPMIDVTFLLLIFFLVTTRFERAEGLLASELPKDSGRPAVALPLSPIVVRLSQTGLEPDNITISIDKFAVEPSSFDELADALRAIQRQPGFDKDTPVVIVAEGDVRWDHVVSCWNAALRAGCTRIAFGEP